MRLVPVDMVWSPEKVVSEAINFICRGGVAIIVVEDLESIFVTWRLIMLITRKAHMRDS